MNKISKTKILFLALLCLFAMSNFATVRANSSTETAINSTPGTIQGDTSFGNGKTSSGVSATRRVYLYSYGDSATSPGLSRTAYGGRAGASVSLSAGASFSHPKYGIGLSLSYTATHNVPPYTYGQIALKSTFTVNVYDTVNNYV